MHEEQLDHACRPAPSTCKVIPTLTHGRFRFASFSEVVFEKHHLWLPLRLLDAAYAAAVPAWLLLLRKYCGLSSCQLQ